MVEKEHPKLSLVQQCVLLSLRRNGLYYTPRPTVRPDELEVKAEIDRTYTSMPFYGVARMTQHLQNKGFDVGEKRVRRYLKEMCIAAIYPKPHTTLANKEHKIYPYLLQGLKIEWVN